MTDDGVNQRRELAHNCSLRASFFLTAPRRPIWSRTRKIKLEIRLLCCRLWLLAQRRVHATSGENRRGMQRTMPAGVQQRGVTTANSAATVVGCVHAAAIATWSSTPRAWSRRQVVKNWDEVAFACGSCVTLGTNRLYCRRSESDSGRPAATRLVPKMGLHYTLNCSTRASSRINADAWMADPRLPHRDGTLSGSTKS